MDLEKIFKCFELPPPIRSVPLKGGANNRVFKLELIDGQTVVLKQYFSHPDDPRNRLQAEFSFLQYAWDIGICNVPKPIACSSMCNAAIYSFIPGRPVEESDISDQLIEEKMAFFVHLNQHKSKGLALSQASESCFSLNDYMQITEKRLERLSHSSIEHALIDDLRVFIHTDLIPKCNQLKDQASKIDQSPIDLENRCISPSDFGFHNALMTDKNVYFIDFEYAGWDDPCKTICDLFCQPKIPIPKRYFANISQTIFSTVSHPEECLQRMKIILPIMQLKWCCILLNGFTRVGKDRRTFSHSDEMAHLENQLKKAKHLFLTIGGLIWPM